jgi:hypothetical protein
MRMPSGFKERTWSTPWVHPVREADLALENIRRLLTPADFDLICGALELRVG